MRVILAMTGQAIHRQRRLRDIPGDMAGLAIEIAMGSGERVSRLGVVIVAPTLPAVRIVTEPTAGPQAAFMMLVAVAGVAIERRALELQRAMAFLAGYNGMAPDQRKPGDVMIERRCFPPAGLSVTLLAATSKLALVLVVLLVTGHAGRCQLVAIEIPGVTEIAFDLRMRGSQRVFRLVMIEMKRFPPVLVVTTLALGAVAPGVNVLNLVAIQTQGADALVALANMARRAGDGGVGALERKFRRAVVERLDHAPFGLTVAIVAFLAKAPLMRVVGLVTVEATPGRLAEFHRWGVTAGAWQRLVRVPQFEIREGVIERLAIEQDDVGISSLVIGMTMVAFLLCGIRLATVKSPARRTIRGNVFVAIEAEPRLGSS